MKICLVCATEYKVKVKSRWSAIGHCKLCEKFLILFDVKDLENRERIEIYLKGDPDYLSF